MRSNILANSHHWRGCVFLNIIIFANGVLENPAREVARWLRPGDCVIAADGGTRHALTAGIVPAHIIGDLDSLPPGQRADLERQGTVFHPHPPAKDETDLELALLWAAASGKKQDASDKHPTSCIIVLGALGGRPDQAFANLLLLALPALVAHTVIIADGAWTIRCLHGGQTHTLYGTPGDTLSLIPLNGPAIGIHTTGLAYPLHDETLHVGPARGVSNAFTAEQATVALQQGTLWCFHETQPKAES